MFPKLNNLILFVLICSLFENCSNNTHDTSSEYCALLLDSATARYDLGHREYALKILKEEFPLREAQPYDCYLYYRFLSRFYLENNKAEECIKVADTCLYILESNKLSSQYPDEYVHILLEKGQAYAKLERYDEASLLYSSGYDFASKHNKQCVLNEYAYQIAMSLFAQGQYIQSAKYFEKAFKTALQCYEADRPYQRMQELLGNIGLCHYNLRAAEKAIFYLDSGIRFIKINAKKFNEHTFRSNLAHQHNNRGAAYLYLGETTIPPTIKWLNKARADLETSKALLLKNNPQQKTFIQNILLARVLAYSAEETEAYRLLTEVKPKENEVPVEYSLAWKTALSDVQRASGNYKDAYQTYFEIANKRDSIANAKLSTQKIDIVRDLEAKEQEYSIQLLTKDALLFKLYLGGAIVLGIFVIIIIWFSILSKAKRKTIELKTRFSSQLILNQENERKNIAKELHDNIGQHVLFLKTRLSRLNEPDLLDASQEVIEQVQSLSKNLYPNQLERYGLVAAIGALIEKTQQISSAFISYEIEALNTLIGKEQSINLYRIVQECLSNAIKHAEAKAIRITAEIDEQVCTLTIQDNGKGFSKESLEQKTQQSFGMLNLEERVNLLNGTFDLDTQIGKGTKLMFTFPIN